MLGLLDAVCFSQWEAILPFRYRCISEQIPQGYNKEETYFHQDDEALHQNKEKNKTSNTPDVPN